MPDQSAIRAALDIGPSAGAAARTIDITTTGAKSGDPRRIEIWFHQLEGRWYITGVPPHPRAWFHNLELHPHFTFHLKHGVQADLAATARPITDEDERRKVFGLLTDGLTDPSITSMLSDVPPIEAWVASSPLVEVVFDDLGS